MPRCSARKELSRTLSLLFERSLWVEDAEGTHELVKFHHVVLLQVEKDEELQSHTPHTARQKLIAHCFKMCCLWLNV